MKIYSIRIPIKIIVDCLDYSAGLVKTSKEEQIELEINVKRCNSEEEAIESAKRAIQWLIDDEISVGLKRNSDYED